jgi:hypothetical protein
MTPALIPEQLTPFQQLSEAAKAWLPTLLRECLDEDRAVRREEVRKAWELRLFAKGIQQLYYDSQNYVYYALSPENVSFKLPTHRAVFDITSPHKRSFVSILSENPPGVNFIPNDLSKSIDQTAATSGEKQRSVVDREIDMKDKQTKAAGILCTDGRVVGWTREEQGKLRVDLYGALESKLPPFAESKDDFDYLILSREANVWKAKFDNPEFKDKISSSETGSTNSYYERYARLSIVARKGNFAEAFKSLVTEHWAFVRSWRYEKAPDEVQEELEALFPDGILMHAFGSVVVDVQTPDWSGLSLAYPVDGEGQIRPALLNGMPYIQRAYNDFRNQQRDAADFAAPRTVFHGGAIDGEALEEQETAWGAAAIITPPNGMSIQQCMEIEPGATIPEWSVLLQSLKQDGENLTGDFPSLYGGDTPGQDTVGVNRLLNNQAKGQLGPGWAAIQSLFAQIYQAAVPISAMLSNTDSMAVQGKTGQESYNPQTILEGGFYCHPDKDSSFPETMADKRASFAQLSADIASMGDAGALILGHPENLELRVMYSGISDFFIPGAAAGKKTLRMIEQCLQEPPVPILDDPAWQQSVQVAVMNRQPPPDPPMRCSVQIDPEWDYLSPMADKVQQWLSSPSEYDEQRKGNTLGLQNVKLLGKQIRDALTAQQAQQKPQQEPMKISGAFKDLDPATQVQVLQRDGYQPAEEYYATGAMQDAQGKAASTQETAASAQHKSVLAAKEAVAHELPGTPDKGEE